MICAHDDTTLVDITIVHVPLGDFSPLTRYMIHLHSQMNIASLPVGDCP